MFEVLMFIFENYTDSNILLKVDNQVIAVELEKVGFARDEIDGALSWLDGLNRFQVEAQSGAIKSSHAIRHYLPEETEQLGKDGKGFLLYLEQLNVLDSVSREIIIDRLMVLDKKEVNLGRIKWVVLMVLFNQPDKKSALSLLQDMILSDAFDVLH